MKAPKQQFRKHKGGSLVMVVSVSLAVVLALFFVVIAYNQMFTEQREAQTAIDAAALAAAKELAATNVFDGSIGPVGVVDSLQNNQITKRPVYGINTLVGRARLGTVFATRLGKGGKPNQTMLFLARQDAEDCKAAAANLAKELKKTAALTKVKNAAVAAYNSNNRRATRQGNITPAQVTVEVGYLGGNGSILSNIPVPATKDANHFPGNQDQFSTVVNNVRLYRANMNIPVANTGLQPSQEPQFVLSPIGDSPRLVDRASFQTNSTSPYVVPSVVRVTVRESVSRTDPGKRAVTGNKQEIACACAGGSRVPTTAGIFRIEFPQGLPQDTVSPNVNVFASIRTFINASDLGPGGANPTNAKPWTGNGTLFTATGGPFPGGGKVGFGQIPKNLASGAIETPNPSVAAASYLYHWLRNDCLRPNVDAVVAAFDASLREPTPKTNSFAQVPRGNSTVIAFDGLDNLLIQKAWAASKKDPEYCTRIFGAIFDLDKDGSRAMGNRRAQPTDLRSLSNLARNPADAKALDTAIKQSFVFAMQASTPQQLAFADKGAIATGLTEDGKCPTSVDGNPLSEIADYVEALSRSQGVSTQAYSVAIGTFNAIQEVRDELAIPMNEIQSAVAAIDVQLARMNPGPARTELLEKRAELVADYNKLRALDIEEVRKQNRARNVLANAQELIINTNALIGNMLALSSRGIDRIQPTDPNSKAKPEVYKIAGAVEFSPPETLPTDLAIRGSGNVPTGQHETATGPGDWANLTTGFLTGNPGSYDFQCTSIVPTSLARNFRLVTNGDASFGTGGGVTMAVDSKVGNDFSANAINGNNFENISGVSATLEDQSRYQALNAYDPVSECDRAGEDRIRVYWSMMGLDNVSHNGNTNVDVRNEETKGNRLDCGRSSGTTIPGLEGQQACDNEAGRIQITSPFAGVNLPEAKPVPPVPNVPPVAPTLPKPPPPPPPPSH